MSESLGEWDDDLEDTALPTEPAEEDSDKPELFYPTVAEFVSNKLATSYRRQLNVQGGVTWCPQWWKHAEAISRLEALWRPALNRWATQGLQPGRRPPRQTHPLPCQ